MNAQALEANSTSVITTDESESQAAKTHVVIATTEGYAFIQRITEEDPGVQSVICLDGTVQDLRQVSSGYRDFVRRGSGVIARDFGHSAFRIDVSKPIDQGNSWQLPVYLAHALHQQGKLGDGKPQRGDRVLWATGEVDIDLSVRRVAGVAQKLAHAIAPVRELREQGIEVQLLVPTENMGEGAGHAEVLGSVSGVTRLADVLPQANPTLSSNEECISSNSSPTLSVSWLQRRWIWAALTAVALAIGVAGYFGYERLSNVDAVDLDDFGGRSAR